MNHRVNIFASMAQTVARFRHGDSPAQTDLDEALRDVCELVGDFTPAEYKEARAELFQRYGIPPITSAAMAASH